MNLNNNEVQEPTIAEFFAGKNVFVTGGTGFIGTVLLEALLSTTPKLGNIYLLIRDKYGSDTNERVRRLLSKQIFDAHSKETMKKVIPVVGVMDQPKFGLNDEVYDDLCGKVNVIFHCAATIKFNTHLRVAIRTNLTGTLRCIEFAKNLKDLATFVHLSTAFCNSNYRGLLSEKVYAPVQDPYEMLKLAEDDDAWVNVKTRSDWLHYLDGHPNTYTFTKQCAENLVIKEMAGYPAAIIRPSIVYGTDQYPVQGWVGNASSGHLGFFAGYYKGLFRTIYGSGASKIDVIPCDYVINSSIALGWYAGTRKLDIPEVIHCTSGDQNPLSIEEYTDILNEKVGVHPSLKMVWKPSAKIRNGWRHTLFFYVFHIFPTMLWYWPEKLLGLGIRHHTSLEFMRIFDKGTKAFHFFLHKNFQYSTKNGMRIMSLMHPQDAERYNFDATDLDWGDFMEINFLGVRRYYFRESYKTTTKHRIVYLIFQFVHWFGLISMIWMALGLLGGINNLFGAPLSTTAIYGLSTALWAFFLWL